MSNHVHKSKRLAKHTRCRARVRRHDWATWMFHNMPKRPGRLADYYDNEKWR